MSNTGYRASTSSGDYLLKLYSNPSDVIECAMYKYLADKVNVPDEWVRDIEDDIMDTIKNYTV